MQRLATRCRVLIFCHHGTQICKRTWRISDQFCIESHFTRRLTNCHTRTYGAMAPNDFHATATNPSSSTSLCRLNNDQAAPLSGDIPSQPSQPGVLLILLGRIHLTSYHSSILGGHTFPALIFIFGGGAKQYGTAAIWPTLSSSKPLCVYCRNSSILEPNSNLLWQYAKLHGH